MIEVNVTVIITKTVQKTVSIPERYLNQIEKDYQELNPINFIDKISSLANDGTDISTTQVSIESNINHPIKLTRKLLRSDSCGFISNTKPD